MLRTFFFGFLFVVGGYVFMDRILTMFGASAETIDFAREYMDIVLPGMFMTTLTFNLVGLIRSSGYPVKSMFILAGGAILNIILDSIFIFVFKTGIGGAAWATTISMTVSSIDIFRCLFLCRKCDNALLTMILRIHVSSAHSCRYEAICVNTFIKPSTIASSASSVEFV